MCHMGACALLNYLSIVWLKMVPLQGIKSWTQLLKTGALSVVFCGSLVEGNISLRFLPLMTVKRVAWLTYAALVPVVAGVFIARGLPLIRIGATAARAFNSVLQWILLSSEGLVMFCLNMMVLGDHHYFQKLLLRLTFACLFCLPAFASCCLQLAMSFNGRGFHTIKVCF
ncbi:hypothetical protein AMTRI_Chr01g111910 [Amborella trichopoda]